jgi:hypothetical protein
MLKTLKNNVGQLKITLNSNTVDKVSSSMSLDLVQKKV